MSSNEHTGAETEVVVLSPPGNPAAFAEIREFSDDGVVIHDWRFAESDLASIHDMVEGYRDEVPDAVLPELDGTGFAAMFIACTGMSYGYAPEEDRSYWRRLEDASGMRIATATRAVEELWEEQGHDSMILVSPYDDRATSEAEEYWSRVGVRVAQIVRVQGGHPYRVTSEDLERAIREARLEPGVPILLSGTGMRTKDSLAWIAGLHDAPVWSVNLAGARWLERIAE